MWARLTALVTAFFFTATNCLWAQPLFVGANQTPEAAKQLLPFEELSIPKEMGSIEDKWESPKRGAAVILIQDAHAIPDAQRSIQRLIEHFERRYGINTIALEGASSALDPQIFRSFPDQKLLAKVFEEYMQNGELAGGPAAAIFSDRNASYYGIEDWDLYEQGIRHYQEAMAVEGQVMEKLNAQKSNLKDQKKKTYSKELFQLDQSLEEFYENHVNLPEILKQLASIKAPQANSELAILLEETKRQGDEDSLATEVSRLAENIHRHLKKNAFSKEARDILMEFNQKHQDFSTSRLAPQAFALYLKKVAADHQIPVRVSKALYSRTKKQQKLENIKGTKLFDDFEHYANEVKGSLLKSEEAKRLNELGERLRLIETFAKLELSHDQWNEVKQLTGDNRQYIRNGVYLGNVYVSKEEVGVLQMLDPHFKFYQVANERDEKFLNNLQRLMQKEETDRLVMVTGGFHARNMARIFEESNLSYLLLMPKINSIPNETPYRKQMQGDVSWKDYFEIENGKINLYKAFIRASRDRLLKDGDNRLIKGWRDQIIRDLAEQDRIADSSRYTAYIDEVTGQEINGRETGNKIIAEAIKFADGLRKLHSSGKLTQDNILQLLRPATTEPLVGAAVTSLDPTAIASADLVRPGVVRKPRSEVRVIQARFNETIEDFSVRIAQSSREPVVALKVKFNAVEFEVPENATSGDVFREYWKQYDLLYPDGQRDKNADDYLMLVKASLVEIKSVLENLSERNVDFKNYMQYEWGTINDAIVFIGDLLSTSSIQTRQYYQGNEGGKTLFTLGQLQNYLKDLTRPQDDADDERRRKLWVGDRVGDIENVLRQLETITGNLTEALKLIDARSETRAVRSAVGSLQIPENAYNVVLLSEFMIRLNL